MKLKIIMKKTIILGSDHNGYEVKKNLIEIIKDLELNHIDTGPFTNSPVDYPVYANKVIHEMNKISSNSIGVLICGTGIGMSIAANRYQGIRAALCRSVLEAKFSRKHNDANIICFGSYITGLLMIQNSFLKFINTNFEGGRHERRILKLDQKQ